MYSPSLPQTTAPEDYPLFFKDPEDCAVSDCDIFVGIQVNSGDSNFLNFYIEGTAAAWLAIGFSETPNMVR